MPPLNPPHEAWREKTAVPSPLMERVRARCVQTPRKKKRFYSLSTFWVERVGER
jgi:CRISPR/Cas system endoribonuclease Cas6 (RAMP superfamily)